MSLKKYFPDQSTIFKIAETDAERAEALDYIYELPDVGKIISATRLDTSEHGWIIEYEEPLDYASEDPGFGRSDENDDMGYEGDPGYGTPD